MAGPTAMCTDFTAFVRVMFEFESFVHRKEYEQAKDFLVQSAMKAAPQSITKQRVGALADQLIELERREWNGIWARIITNFIATVQIGPFDCVIGNPEPSTNVKANLGLLSTGVHRDPQANQDNSSAYSITPI